MRSNPRPLIDFFDGWYVVPIVGDNITVTGRITTPTPPLEVTPERRQEPATMSKETMTTEVRHLLLETGQKQEKQASNLLFFCYVTPTGAEISIGKCPQLKKVWGRSEGGFEGQSRLQKNEYQVLAPITIKMVNICTVFGSSKRTVNLFIDLNPDHAVLEFTGLEGFGMFKGRGKINYKKSVFRDYSATHTFNDQIMKEMFNLRILQPPRLKGSQKVRSLIF